MTKSKQGKIKGLGDVVYRVAKKFGIKECDSCARRRAFLNKFRVPRFKRK